MHSHSSSSVTSILLSQIKYLVQTPRSKNNEHLLFFIWKLIQSSNRNLSTISQISIRKLHKIISKLFQSDSSQFDVKFWLLNIEQSSNLLKGLLPFCCISQLVRTAINGCICFSKIIDKWTTGFEEKDENKLKYELNKSENVCPSVPFPNGPVGRMF